MCGIECCIDSLVSNKNDVKSNGVELNLGDKLAILIIYNTELV